MLKNGKEPQINRLALELNGYLIQVKSQDFMRTIAEETHLAHQFINNPMLVISKFHPYSKQV
jgi:hypothetical protein